MGHAVEVVCFIFWFLMVLFLCVTWMIYCTEDMMAFTVVFNILKINKVHTSTSTTSVVGETGSGLISACASCVEGAQKQCWSLYFLVFAYLYCVPMAKKRCDKNWCWGLLQICTQREKWGEWGAERKMGLREREEGNVSTGMMHEHNSNP